MPRIASFNQFVRPSQTRDVNKKYFFALEGTKTEVKYVKAIVTENRISHNVFYYYRNAKECEPSNLLSITRTILDVIDGKSEFEFRYADLSSIVYHSFLKNNTIVSETRIKRNIQSYLTKNNININEAIKIDAVEELIKVLNWRLQKNDLNYILSNDLLEIIKEQSTYIEGIDEIIIIGDRDKKSFTDLQYDSVLTESKKHNMKLIISNPCIEFWFLLHFTDCKDIDTSDWNIVDNAAALVIKELKRYDKSYSKTGFKPEKYLLNTTTAINNVSNYETNIDKLKNNIGSNMSLLFSLFKK